VANEITYQLQSLLNNGGLSDNYSSGSVAVDQASAKMVRNVQTIGTAAAGEALSMGDVTTAGVAVLKNLDDTNYVEVGRSIGGNFEAFLKLKPGESALCRLATSAPYAKANTADVELDYRIYED